MAQFAATAAGRDILVDEAPPRAAAAPPRTAPDHPELEYVSTLVVSAAWWLLVAIAVIQSLRG
jgi:hypothetical protein